MLLFTKLYATSCGCLLTTARISRVQLSIGGKRFYTHKTDTPKNYRMNNADDAYAHLDEAKKLKIKSLFNYMLAGAFAICGLGFAAVPLFNAFCRVTNYAGTLNIDLSKERTKSLKRVEDCELTIAFNADKSSYLQWKFKPLQGEIKVAPGETVLAFYSAENPTDKPVSGISTYNVIPFEAAKYFNKIQCFCFDEQRLNPREQVDMPVFFYIDPDYVDDPYLQGVKNITLSYTFFEAIEGLDLPFMSSFRDE